MSKTQNTENTDFIIRPNFQKKFRPTIVHSNLHEVLIEQLSDKDYDDNTVEELTKSVANAVRTRMKKLELERYKLIVQVVIGEQRGQGSKMSARCHWDADTDNFVQDLYINSTLYCIAAVFGIFHY